MFIQLSEKNKLNLKIDEEVELLREIRDYFSDYSPGYQFDWRYKAGKWDGKISLFDRNSCTLPYGLLGELLKFKKQNYPEDVWEFSQEVKQLFKGLDLEVKQDLKLIPRDYQLETIKAAIKIRRGIFSLPTSAGKSLVISYIWKTLFENQQVSKTLIIVPNLNLISQFHSDLIDYGIKTDLIGEVWSKEKQWDKSIVISTWQSLVKYPKKYDEFDCIFVDEVHGYSSYNSKKLLSNLKNAYWRFGCTGTMPESNLDNLNVLSYLGPVFKTISTDYLTEKGYITKCTIKQIEIDYKKYWDRLKDGKRSDYHEVKDAIFHSPFRLEIIKKYLKEIKDNVKVLLVSKVEDEGEFLKNYLLEDKELCNQEIIFMSGSTKKKEREEIRQKAIKNDHPMVIVSTWPILKLGWNCPSLAHVFFCSSMSSKVSILQSVGRALRLHSKKSMAYIYDFIDNQNRFFSRHALKREGYYNISGFNIEHYNHKEK